MRKLFRAFWNVITAPFRLIWWILKSIVGFFRYLWNSIRFFFEDETEAQTRPDFIGELIENPREMLPSLLDHITALRKHLMRASLGLFLTTTAAFIFAKNMLEIIAKPIGGLENVQAVEVTESIGVFMRVSLLLGFTLASPYIIFEMLLFIAPGLEKRERKFALAAIPIVTILFIGGMVFAYSFMLEPALGVLIGFMDIPTKVRPSSYYPFVTSLMFWIGISFEFPVVMLVLSYLRILKTEFLMKNIRIAIVLLAILAASITPTVDPVNMLLVWGPLVGLYFLGLGLSFVGERARGRENAKTAK